VETGKVRYVFRAAFYDEATRLAAEALYCAGEQGRFWEIHDWLFEHGDKLAMPEDTIRFLVQEAAPAAGVDGEALRACLREGRYRSWVEKLQAQANALGIQGTPTFLIDGELLQGALPLDVFRQKIEEALAR